MSKNDISLLTIEQRIALIEQGHLWCTATFLIGIAAKLQKILFSKEMVVFGIVSYLFLTKGSMENDIQWVSYLAMGVVFILAESLRVLVAKNTKMDIGIKAGINKEIKDGRSNDER